MSFRKFSDLEIERNRQAEMNNCQLQWISLRPGSEKFADTHPSLLFIEGRSLRHDLYVCHP